jgi:endonuclease/exonuclease/phosphatase family metal-dependent hydrolase
MKLATINLYQFAEQGYYWYDREESNTYHSREWKKKQLWVQQQLIAMDADVVGFQEVFSVDALERLVEKLGYPYFATVEAPRTDDQDPQVFVSPVVALASRFPFTKIQGVALDGDVKKALPVADDFSFSRKPICATVNTPDLGEVMVYVVHLKSKRAVMDRIEYAADEPWDARIRDSLLRRSRGDVLSMIQRGLEATLLYHDVILQMQSIKQVVVMGDLNDSEASSPMDALTQRQKIYDIGGIEDKHWPNESRRELHEHRLFDSFMITPNLRAKARPYTHMHHGEPDVLDHILVSNALNPLNREATGEVCQYQVYNQHVRGDDVDNKLQSDHGQVCIEIIPCTPVEKVTKPEPKVAPKRIWTKQFSAAECERMRFIEKAGGVYQSNKDYSHFKSRDKWDHFWAFFFDTDHGWVKSVYGSIPVDTLVQKKRHTIEHIVPRSFINEYLMRKRVPRSVRFGAETNPLNFVPADRTLNSRRSSFQFDFQGDEVKRPHKIHLNPQAYSSTGHDTDEEWVVPKRSQGDIARAILYMLLVYEIDELYLDHLNTLVHWAKVDMPSKWELAYNDWVQQTHGIRNPFIDTPAHTMEWLNDESLLKGLMCKNQPSQTEK